MIKASGSDKDGQRVKDSDRQRHVCSNGPKDEQDIKDSCISYFSRTSHTSAFKQGD